MAEGTDSNFTTAIRGALSSLWERLTEDVIRGVELSSEGKALSVIMEAAVYRKDNIILPLSPIFHSGVRWSPLLTRLILYLVNHDHVQ